MCFQIVGDLILSAGFDHSRLLFSLLIVFVKFHGRYRLRFLIGDDVISLSLLTGRINVFKCSCGAGVTIFAYFIALEANIAALFKDLIFID